MKLSLKFCFVWILFAISAYSVGFEDIDSSKPIIIDKIVVFVNKSVITSNQVDIEYNLLKLTSSLKGVVISDNNSFRDNLINQMALQKAQIDIALRYGIKVTDDEVEDSISRLLEMVRINKQKLLYDLKKYNLTYKDFRKQIYTQLLIEKLKQREISSRVNVSDAEVTRILSSEAYKKRIDYNLSYIIISIPDMASSRVINEKKAIANNAYNELILGKPFIEVSRRYSNAPNAFDGGSIGWRNNATLPSNISNALANIKPNEFTKVIQLPIGFLIFKLNSVRNLNTKQIIRQYDVRHILIKVNNTTSSKEALAKIQKIRKMIVNNQHDAKLQLHEFIKLAKQYSEDTSSVNGGDIGWVGVGDTVKEFEDIMINIPINNVSEPIHTQFGWHLLLVDNVRDVDQTTEQDKALIRRELQEIKAGIIEAEYLRNIKEAAYIKMNDN